MLILTSEFCKATPHKRFLILKVTYSIYPTDLYRKHKVKWPTAGLRAAASRWGTARVEDIIHWALHLTVVNGLALRTTEEGKTDTKDTNRERVTDRSKDHDQKAEQAKH
uniref:Uncharacterized protein n=2 Tax=Oreochromis TaxID=8139 RepID=A0A669D3T8_ORENI